MDIIDAPQAVEAPKGPVQSRVQPVAALSDLDPVLDDNAVRQALANAEANNQDPMSVTLEDMAKGSQVQEAPVPEAETPQVPTPEVPQKFLKPDGTVDVEKLTTSTRQLDEAIQKKETAVNTVQKTVDEYMAEYREKEAKFKNLPNPQRMAAQLPSNPPPTPQQPVDVQRMSDQELEAQLIRDFNANPLLTMANFVDAAVRARVAPIEAKEHDGRIRENLQSLAQRDPRILRDDVFQAINQKLASDADLWKLKNPHKAAWLEVKEEMRLGEPSQAQAQPSRTTAPVLGGGTPPSVPSVSGSQPQNVIGNLDKLDLRDRKQEAMGDEAMRAYFARNNR